jgi:regulatory protein SWI6
MNTKNGPLLCRRNHARLRFLTRNHIKDGNWEVFLDNDDNKRARTDHGPNFSIEVAPQSSLGERHGAPLMAMFLSDNPLSIPDILLQSKAPSDLDVNIIIDDQGHTALHWAAALVRMDILRLLIAKSGNVKVVKVHSQSALIRSILVTKNYDTETFPDRLNILAPFLALFDADGRLVLHHIALVANLLDIMDVHGDTAVNLAARVGAQYLVGQLLDVGGNPQIENIPRLKPSNFGFGKIESDGVTLLVCRFA